MTTAHPEAETASIAAARAPVTGAHRRTLDAIFRHPLAHNLEWNDVTRLFETLGTVDEKGNGEFVFEVAGIIHLMRKPHTKDLTSPEVLELRHFLQQAGASPSHPSEPSAHPDGAAPSLLIVVDHHGAKIFHVDVTADDAAEHVIRPYDPHNFLHHLLHKDQSRERGQRAPEEPA